jgi:hypothetical protein
MAGLANRERRQGSVSSLERESVTMTFRRIVQQSRYMMVGAASPCQARTERRSARCANLSTSVRYFLG